MKQIYEPVRIGHLTCKNRFLRSATWESLSDAEGHMTPGQLAIYEELAKNEVGLICTGYARVLKEEQPNAAMMGIYDDCFVEEYRELTTRVHRYGAKIMMQLAYGGTKTTYHTDGRTIFAPSDIPEKATGTKGTPMTLSDIKYLTEAYAKAALRVKESGFDAVQIHGGHSYLLNQFLSPYYNKRQDAYGGSLENRMRLICEIYDAMREEVGPEFPILIKLTCSDFMEGGLNFTDVRSICRKLEVIGMDAIEITGNIHGKANRLIGQVYDGHPIIDGCFFLAYASMIAGQLQIPVYVTGGVSDISLAEEWINTTDLAGFGLCRPLLAEPDLIRRWKDGDRTKAKCVHCSRCRTPEGNYCTVYKKRNDCCISRSLF